MYTSGHYDCALGSWERVWNKKANTADKEFAMLSYLCVPSPRFLYLLNIGERCHLVGAGAVGRVGIHVTITGEMEKGVTFIAFLRKTRTQPPMILAIRGATALFVSLEMTTKLRFGDVK